MSPKVHEILFKSSSLLLLMILCFVITKKETVLAHFLVLSIFAITSRLIINLTKEAVLK